MSEAFRKKIRVVLCWSVVLLFVSASWAQMPHECVLLVNRKSQDSMKVANTYLSMRKIPQRNVIYLDIPENLYKGSATVTPEQFTWLIWEPANKIIKERGLEDLTLAWIYSVDFPIRVKTDTNDRKQTSLSSSDRAEPSPADAHLGVPGLAGVSCSSWPTSRR